MSAIDSARGALCVSVHDVAPATWDDCRRLQDAVREVADIALTWLVVPRFHRAFTHSPAMEAGLDAALDRGDELVLHGYTHLDTAPQGGPGLSRWTRTLYTQREGEFAALSERQARLRIALGLAWFAARGWPVQGFVAPAWLLGEGAWQALADSGFLYTTTLPRFYVLPRGPQQWAPSLVYTARNTAGRLLSPVAMDLGAMWQAQAPLVRLSLHPRDARHPALLRHMQRLLGRLLEHRCAMTKADYARRLTSMDPRTPRHSSAACQSPRNTRDSCRSGTVPPSY